MNGLLERKIYKWQTNVEICAKSVIIMGLHIKNHNEISSYLISSYPVRMATDKKTNKQKKSRCCQEFREKRTFILVP